MLKVKTIISSLSVLFFLSSVSYGQRLYELIHNKNFDWIVDSVNNELIIYYERNSWAAHHIEDLKKRVLYHIKSTTTFIGIEKYDKRIILFALESRDKMALLVGRRTNGVAKKKYVTGIASEDLRSVFSNHELFHLMAMNIWGKQIDGFTRGWRCTRINIGIITNYIL
jgi:hypothetical protein